MPKGLAISSVPLTDCSSENMINYLLLSVFYNAFELVVGGAESLPIYLAMREKAKFPIRSDSPTLIIYTPYWKALRTWSLNPSLSSANEKQIAQHYHILLTAISVQFCTMKLMNINFLFLALNFYREGLLNLLEEKQLSSMGLPVSLNNNEQHQCKDFHM